MPSTTTASPTAELTGCRRSGQVQAIGQDGIGSTRSRSQSPSRLTHRTRTNRAAPGNTVSHLLARCTYCRPAATCPRMDTGWTPRPRKDKPARTDYQAEFVARQTTGGMAMLGRMWRSRIQTSASQPFRRRGQERQGPHPAVCANAHCWVVAGPARQARYQHHVRSPAPARRQGEHSEQDGRNACMVSTKRMTSNRRPAASQPASRPSMVPTSSEMETESVATKALRASSRICASAVAAEIVGAEQVAGRRGAGAGRAQAHEQRLA